MMQQKTDAGTEERWSGFTHDRPAIAADIRRFIETVRQDVPLTADTTVLEVGCGWGITTFHLARLCKVQGVDVSLESLRLNPVRTVSLMEATRLGFADDSFDVVPAHHVLHHIVDIAGTTMDGELRSRPAPFIDGSRNRAATANSPRRKSREATIHTSRTPAPMNR